MTARTRRLRRGQHEHRRSGRRIDQGAVVLDAPVRAYVPDLRVRDEDAGARFTISRLLEHSAGWYGDDATYSSEDDNGIARYVADVLPKASPQQYPLGKFLSYNNSAFTLLGRVIETVTGNSYNTAMSNLLLGLWDSTTRCWTGFRCCDDGHYAGSINGADGVAAQTPMWLPRSVDPAGGIWATTRDVLRYARMHVGDPPAGSPGRGVRGKACGACQSPRWVFPG